MDRINLSGAPRLLMNNLGNLNNFHRQVFLLYHTSLSDTD